MIFGTVIASALVVGVSYIYYITRPPKPKQYPALLTEPVGDVEHHRRNVVCNKKVASITTAYEAFRRGYMMNPAANFLGHRQLHLPNAPYAWLTYEQVKQRSLNIGAALIQNGVQVQEYVGIYGKNSHHWHVILQACNAYNFTLVPLYDTLGQKAMAHILETCKLEVIVVDVGLLYNMLKWIKGSKVRLLICIGKDIPTESIDKAATLGVELITLGELEEFGFNNPIKATPPKSEDIALICYTSGTTGTPKGGIISHGNIAACCMGLTANLHNFILDDKDVLISYLPLAHVYQFAIECFFSYIGAKIGYFQGDLKLLLNDFETLQPTVIPSVPRVLNKAFDKINGLVHKKAIVGALFDKALASKLAEVERGIARRNSIWDYLLFRKVQKSFGGKCRLLITGSAPCRGDILQWYRAVLGCFVMEGFGQTEMSGVATMGLEGDHTVGHIGAPMPSLETKLVDVPEKEYFAKDNKGEICFKGPNVFKGYLNEPEKTADSIDEEGWLHTGDIGTWTPHGCVAIIDRKKNVFKLAQGEYIAPDKIEAIYERAPIVNQCFIYGESLKSSLVGLVVPDEAALAGIDPNNVSLEEFVADKNNAGLVLQTIQTLGQKELKSFEQVRHITLISEAFAVENNLITPTMKKRRDEISVRYRDILGSMLENMS